MIEDYERLASFTESSAEQAVIGSILIDAESVLPTVRGKLRSDDFYFERNRNIFIAACKLTDEDKPVDPVTLQEPSGAKTEYLLELMAVTPTAANVDAYIELVLNASLKRKLQKITIQAKNDLQDGKSPQEVCAYLQDEANQIAENQTSGDLISGYEACADFYKYLSDISSGKVTPYVKSGYGLLDYILGSGFVKEGLYILAARPGCGKTSLALQIADKVARAKIPTLMMSLEMSKEQITARRVGTCAGIPYNRILAGDINKTEMDKVAEACTQLSDIPLTINRKSSATVDEIGFLARQVKGLGFLVIDYLGLIRPTTGNSTYEKTTEISNGLKRLARTLGVPILCLHQLNREVEGRPDRKPRASDLRDSGAIEQDADGILLLYRNLEEAHNDDITPAELVCTIGKNRHGRTGEIKFSFYMGSGRIYGVSQRGEYT